MLALSLAASGISLAPATAAVANAAPVRQGFSVSPADLRFILEQIKIAEAHVQNTTAETGPCGALLGTGPDQVPSPLAMLGVRTVDGSCNNLQPGQEEFGASSRLFPRLTDPVWRDADWLTTYAEDDVVDADPRVISNLIVDQTATNPAAIAAAGFPVRAANGESFVPCDSSGLPAGCVPLGETLPILNVTTDFGLSAPSNGWFVLFGQFFDHGVDKITNGGSGGVFIPLQPDDPLYVEGAETNFMALTRGTALGPDGTREALNTDTPWVDLSQAYASHPSHQVFIREYDAGGDGPVANGRLFAVNGGLPNWGQVKTQAADLLGLQLVDLDVHDIPVVWADAYGNFIPGPNGYAQWMTATGPVEGDPDAPVAAPANVLRTGIAFLNDMSHPANPGPTEVPDADDVAGSPTTPAAAGTYDDELLDLHYIAGDGRLNENIGLTAVHQVFHAEHDRLAAEILDILAANPDLDAAYRATDATTFEFGERLFQAARFVTEMEYQHLVFEEFARKIQPGINPFQQFAFGNTDIDPAITAEFAHAVYRFGHSQLREDIARSTPSGESYDIALLSGFLNPAEFTRGANGDTLTPAEAVGGIVMGMSEQVSSEIDEFVTDTLRNSLVGLPLDLATLNLARGRSEGVPPLNEVRRQLNATTNDPALVPYANWIEFGDALRHPTSLVNFVAAYGHHPSILGATTVADKREAARLLVAPQPQNGDVMPDDAADFLEGAGDWAGVETGVNDIDLWVGGLAEISPAFGGLLGSTFNHIFERQLTDLQNGDRFYYIGRTLGMNLRMQLEGNSFAEVIERNSTASALKADVFSVSDCKFELGSNPGIANRQSPWNSSIIQDDPNTECNEQLLLVRRNADNQIRYRQNNVVDTSGFNGQSVFNGTAGVDNIYGGNDNDTLLGNDGNDIIDGGAGADHVIGGEGNDRLTDFAGDDVLKGGPGNDALDGGPGFDILHGGTGSDVSNGGENDNDHFLAEGDDFSLGGVGADVIFGGSGDDWLQGGGQQDLLIGDSSTFFFTDYDQPGHDVFLGQSGDDDYDGEGGDDIFVADSGLEKNSGAAGFDWVTGIFDPQPLVEDMSQRPIEPGQVGVETRSRYFEVEGLSGGDYDDILLGDNEVPVSNGSGSANGFVGCDALDEDGIARIAGLDVLITPAMLTVDAATVEAVATTRYCGLTGNVWGAGNIILGGLGSDVIQGRGGDDILDGDRHLLVRLSVRTDVTDPRTEIGSALALERLPFTGTFGPGTDGMTLQQAIFAGRVDPGHVAIVREIITSPVTPADCADAAPSNCDTARFAGNRSEYTITVVGDTVVVSHTDPVRPVPAPGAAGGFVPDGTDVLRNIERLEFADGSVLIGVPDAPTDVVALAGIESVTVFWTEPFGVLPDVTSYVVTVLDVTNVIAPVAVRTVDVPAPAPFVVVEPLTPGVPYSFTVTAVNDLGAGPASDMTPAVIPMGLPGAPTGVTATGSSTTATVSWTAPSGPVYPAIGLYTLRIIDATDTVVSIVSVNAPATTATVSGLPVGNYTVVVSAVNDAGEGPVSDPPAAFSITNPITVTPTSPTAGATGVALGANMLAITNVVVSGLSTGGNSTNVILEQVSTGARVAAQVSYNNGSRVITINPNADLAYNTTYRVRVLAGACAPASGIRLTNPCRASAGTTWTFTTEANAAPTVLARVPAAGATGVDRDNNLVITMSERVNGVSGTTVRLTRVSNGATVLATLSVTNAGVITVNPIGRLAANADYRVDLGQSANGFFRITDTTGLAMTPVNWTFRTGPN